MLDAAIIGGGPAGLHTARLLARAGFAVGVFEEHPRCGLPVHCTGVVAADVFEQFDLPRESLLNPLATARFISPSGLEIVHTTAATEAVVIDRGVFDASMARHAAEAGAELHAGSRVQRLEAIPTGVRVHRDEHPPIDARTVVLACGARYRLQRELGMGLPPVTLNSAQIEVPARRDGDVEVYFGSDVAPTGFAWVVPVRRPTGPHVRIGLMGHGDTTAGFRRFLDRVASAWGVQTETCPEPRRRLLPLSALPRTYASRLLAVGDAAGLVKPTTGGGIYYSLVSAALAAETLTGALRANRLEARDLAVYQDRWRDRLIPEFRTQLALRMLARHLSDADIDGLFELARTTGVMPLVRKTARFNQHRHLIAELFRHAPARRLLFRRLVAT
jgi:geranylgeranyl reductase family protein